MKRLAFTGVILFFTIFAGISFWQKIQKKPEKTVTESSLQKEQPEEKETVSASGKIRAEREVDLKFQTSGKLVWVGVKEGDKVEKWQILAQLDITELQKTLEKTLRDYAKQRNDFEETYRVTYKEQTPYSAITDTVKRILEKNQWDLDKAVLDVELKDYALKLALLTTPISGIVTHIDSPIAGVNITPAAAVFTVADPNSVEFIAEVDELDIVRLWENQKAVITLDSQADKPIESRIKKISFTSIKTSGGGTAYEVFLELPKNDNLQFRLGMNGDVEFKWK